MEPEQKEEKVPTRDTYWGRWQIIRECQIPAEFVASGKKRKQGDKTQDLPGAHVVKAVLLDLAEHDKPGNSIFKGLDSVQHATGLSMRSINKGIKALEDAGIIKRKHRGMGKSKYSVLDWDRVESLRKPFFAVNRDGDGASPRADSEDQRFGDELPLEPSSSVSAAILSLKFVGSKLTRKDAESVVGALVKAHGEDAVQQVISSFTSKQLASAGRADNVSKYLRKCIENSLKEGGKVAAPGPEQSLTSDVTDDYLRSAIERCAQGEALSYSIGPRGENNFTDDYIAELRNRMIMLASGRILISEPTMEGSQQVIFLDPISGNRTAPTGS